MQLGHCLLQFGLSIHHDWPVPGDWFLDRFSGHQQETNAVLACLHRDLVAGIEQHQRTVSGLFPHQDFVAIHLLLAEYADRLRGRMKRSIAFENVCKGVTLDLDLQRLASTSGHKDVEISWIGSNPVDWTFFAPEVAAYDPHARAVIIDDFGDIRAVDVLISRRRHLERGRQVGPELKAVHATLRIALWHFLMHDAAPGCHPLHIARTKCSAVAQPVAVLNCARQYIRDCFDAAMPMPGETGEIVAGPVMPEVIVKGEWICFLGVAETKCATQPDASTFNSGLRLHDALNGAD